MEAEVSLAAVGAAVLAGLGYFLLQALGEVAADEAKEAAFRRPSLAMRRRRHRGLMKAGFLCAVLAFGSAFLWLAVITNDFQDDARDARMFLALVAIFGVTAVCLLAAWWRRAGKPPH